MLLRIENQSISIKLIIVEGVINPEAIHLIPVIEDSEIMLLARQS